MWWLLEESDRQDEEDGVEGDIEPFSRKHTPGIVASMKMPIGAHMVTAM